MPTIDANGTSLYYEEHGTGVPVLCVHGTGSSALVWAGAVPELARRGRVITYDRRGCTRSARPEPYDTTTVREHTDDAAALLRAMDAAPAVVIGRSYGGEIGVDLVQRHPDLVRALVLLEPAVLTLSTEARAWADVLTADVRAADVPADRFYRRVLGDETWDGLPDELRQILLGNERAILAELGGYGQPSTPDASVLAGVTRPVLIVSGESSPPVFRAVDDTLAGMIPGARHEIVGGGHMVDPAGPVVLAFLDEILAPGADDG